MSERDVAVREGDVPASAVEPVSTDQGTQVADAVSPERAADDRPRERGLSTADLAGSGTNGRDPRPAPRRDESSAPDRAPLFEREDAGELRRRWDGVQVGFVDEPRRSVEQADGLVAEVMQSLASAFARERSALEEQWNKGEEVSTEDLRQTLRRYRSFFDRLLSL
jgi:hypothetical protein